MPYKDSSLQREYTRRWVARRRAEWFAGKACAQCHNPEDLELDHIDPATKVSHAIWSWSQQRREAELAKCQVLCHSCHKTKSAAESSVRQSSIPITHGTYWGYRRGCRCDDCDWAYVMHDPVRKPVQKITDPPLTHAQDRTRGGRE